MIPPLLRVSKPAVSCHLLAGMAFSAFWRLAAARTILSAESILGFLRRWRTR